MQELFEDIKNSYSEDYFIGTIVVTDKNNYLEIVDGQQRLATISMFFAAVRDLMQKNNDEQKASVIENKYLIEESIREDKKQKLMLNGIDNDYYLNMVIEQQDIKTAKESHIRIKTTNPTSASMIAGSRIVGYDYIQKIRIGRSTVYSGTTGSGIICNRNILQNCMRVISKINSTSRNR